jgi:TetR/AcrR family transcriptional repressor of uid operon
MPKVTEAHLQARRQQILDAATEGFAEKGFHQTTMHDICQLAELSPGAVYRYFSSKEEIIEAMVEQRRQQGIELMKAAGERRDTVQALEELARMFFAKLEDPKGCALDIALWSEAASNPAVRERLRDYSRSVRSAFADIVSGLQKQGVVNPDLDPEAVAEVHISFFEGLIVQRAIDPELDVWKYLEAVRAITNGQFSLAGANRETTDGAAAPAAQEDALRA